jgi:phage-related baseplate assembly protein
MVSRYHAPDLSLLPAPALIDTVSFEAILAAQKQWVLDRWAQAMAVHPEVPPLDTLGLETEPMTIVLEAYAAREVILRALVNDKAKAILLAYSTGTDLDQVGALYPITRAEGETDASFRERVQMLPEGFSVAGPRGAYISWARSYDPVAIPNAWAWSPRDGEVQVVIAGPAGADVSDAVLAGVVGLFRREDVAPLTDVITVRRAVRVDYAVAGTIIVPRGPDPDVLKTNASAAVNAYAAERCKIGVPAYLNGIIAAAKAAGVENVILTSPLTDVLCDNTQISNLMGVNLTPLILD